MQKIYKDLVMSTNNKDTYKKLVNDLENHLKNLSCTQPKHCAKIGCSTTLDSQNVKSSLDKQHITCTHKV